MQMLCTVANNGFTDLLLAVIVNTALMERNAWVVTAMYHLCLQSLLFRMQP